MTETSNNRQLWLSAILTAVVGLLLSAYSLNHHLEVKASGHTSAACNVNATVNCDKVASSQYAEVAGIPLGVFGIGYFLAMAILAFTVMSNHKTRPEHEPTWFALAAVGVLTSVILGGISIGVIQAVCLVCFGIYIAAIVQFVIAAVLWNKSESRPVVDIKAITNGGTTAAVIVAVVVVAFNFLKPAAQLPPELQDTAGKHDSLLKGQNNGKNQLSLLPTVNDIPVNRTAYSGVGEDYRLGNDDAKVVVVEFADYQCPACRDAKDTMDKLHGVYGNKILIVFKNYPLSNKCNSSVQSNMHPHSCDIATLARCAGQYGKFWDFHRMAFDNQSSASLDAAKGWGRQVGMSDPQMETCLGSADIQAKIRDDVGLANKAGLDGTPTLFINGRKFVGDRSVEGLRAVIDPMLY